MLFCWCPMSALGQIALDQISGPGDTYIKSYIDNGNDYVRTDRIFYGGIQKGNDNGFEYYIATTGIEKYGSDGSSYFDPIIVCFDKYLNIKFLYPFGTVLASRFNSGISEFSLNAFGGKVGAVDSIGTVILQPKYDYITISDSTVNGIKVISHNDDEVTFLCNVFSKDSPGEYFEFVVYYKDILPVKAFHYEFESLIKPEYFLESQAHWKFNDDEKNYIMGMHRMLNMDYRNALIYFKKIDCPDNYIKLKHNMQQCRKAIKKK